MDSPAPALETCNIRCIAGKEAVMRALPELELAASAWSQQALVREVPFSLAVPDRSPVLVLFSADPVPGFQGAVLLYAYGHAVFGKRLLSNSDRVGRIGVFGPEDQRAYFAFAAVRFLLRTGSALVRLSFASEQEFTPDRTAQLIQSPQPDEQWNLRSHELFIDLTLHPTLDETLSQLGRRTRRNMREVMRRCVADLQCRFVAQPDLTLEEFFETNRHSGRRVSSRIARWRYAQLSRPSSFLCGVQTGDGRWLGLAGGRISAETVIVDWQMNDLAFARYSPSLLLRGYLMQHFGQQGLRLLFFAGGTSHRMTRHFNQHRVHFLQVRRRILWLTLLEKFMLRWLPGKAATKVLFGYG